MSPGGKVTQLRITELGSGAYLALDKDANTVQSPLYFFFFLIGVELLYDVALVSAVQQCELAICVHTPSLHGK